MYANGTAGAVVDATVRRADLQHVRFNKRPTERGNSSWLMKMEGQTYRIKSAPIECCTTSSASSGSAPVLVVPARTSSRASGVPTALRSVPTSADGLFDATICCSRLSSISACVGAACVPVAAAGGTGTLAAAAGGASAVCDPEAVAAGVGVMDGGGVGKLSEAIILFEEAGIRILGRRDLVN